MTADNDSRGAAAEQEVASVKTIDPNVAHIARIQDYWLGGKDHFEVDRIAGEEAIAALPDMVASVRNTRAFLGRTVRFLAEERGIRQFLDLGTGIPTAANTHEVAQAVAPESKIVYVDNDPMVLAHARALLASDPAGHCALDQEAPRIHRPRPGRPPSRAQPAMMTKALGRAGFNSGVSRRRPGPHPCPEYDALSRNFRLPARHQHGSVLGLWATPPLYLGLWSTTPRPGTAHRPHRGTLKTGTTT